MWIQRIASIVTEVLEDRTLQNQPLPMAEIINNKKCAIVRKGGTAVTVTE
jgi:hypothetical protein